MGGGETFFVDSSPPPHTLMKHWWNWCVNKPVIYVMLSPTTQYCQDPSRTSHYYSCQEEIESPEVLLQKYVILYLLLVVTDQWNFAFKVKINGSMNIGKSSPTWKAWFRFIAQSHLTMLSKWDILVRHWLHLTNEDDYISLNSLLWY